MLKYKILIKLHVLSCVLICCVYIRKSNYFDVLCNISFKERLLEDGHNRWPKHVGGYNIYNTVNLRVCICMYSYWSISPNKSSVNDHESLKFVTGLCFSARFFRFPLLTTILPLLQHIHSPLPNCAMTLSSFLVIKPTRCTNFTNLFCHETLHVSDSSSVHHQEFIHCTLSNGICHTGL